MLTLSVRRSLAALALALIACRRDAPVAPRARSTAATATDASDDAHAPPRDAGPGDVSVASTPHSVPSRALDGSGALFAQPSPDGRQVAIGTDARAITLVDARDGTPLRRYGVPGLSFPAPRWVSDATLEPYVIDSTGRMARVSLDLATGRIGPVVPQPGAVTDASVDGGASECDRLDEGAPRRYRAYGDWNGQVHVTDCDTGERFVLGDHLENPAVTFGVMTGGVGDLAWSADGRLLAVPFNGVRVWDVARRTSRLVSRAGISAVWRPGGARELTVVERRGGGEDDRLVRLAASGDWRVNVSSWSEGRMRFAWSPDGARLALATSGSFYVYDVARDAGGFESVNFAHDLGAPGSLAWTAQGTLLVAMSEGGVYAWRDGALVWSLERRAEQIDDAGR